MFSPPIKIYCTFTRDVQNITKKYKFNKYENKITIFASLSLFKEVLFYDEISKLMVFLFFCGAKSYLSMTVFKIANNFYPKLSLSRFGTTCDWDTNKQVNRKSVSEEKQKFLIVFVVVLFLSCAYCFSPITTKRKQSLGKFLYKCYF